MAQITLNLKKKLFIPKFFPYLLDYTSRWEVYMGSAGSGKSYFIGQKIITRCCREPITVLVCRKFGTTLRNTCFDLLKEIINKWQLKPYVQIKETDMSFHFPNGSKIIMMGLDEENKLLSLNNVYVIWVEEAYEVPQPLAKKAIREICIVISVMQRWKTESWFQNCRLAGNMLMENGVTTAHLVLCRRAGCC